MKLKDFSTLTTLILLCFSLIISPISVFAQNESLLYGDVDDSGMVTSSDALLALQNAVSKTEFSELQKNVADVDSSGEITSQDALYILQFSVDKINSFPCEKTDLESSDSSNESGPEDTSSDVTLITPTDITSSKLVHNVYDYGAVGDGVTDDTLAFSAAIEDAHSDGLPVYVPAGKFLVTETLTLKNATMYGYRSGAWAADNSDLPLIYHADASKPLFRLISSSISGLHIRVLGVGKDTTDAMATIYLESPGCNVTQMKIEQPFIGIDVSKTSNPNPGRVVIEDVFIIQAWNIGLRMYGCRDVPTLCNIEVWNNNMSYPCPNAFVFADNDDLRAVNLFAFNANVGFLFDVTHNPNGSTSGCWGSFSNCSVDYTRNGVKIDKGVHHLTFTGGTYWCHFSGIEITSSTSEKTLATFSGCEFSSNGAKPTIKVGGGLATTVTACNIVRTASGYSNEPVCIAGGQAVTFSGNTILANGQILSIFRTFKSALNFSGNTILCSLESGGITVNSTSKYLSYDNNMFKYGHTFS